MIINTGKYVIRSLMIEDRQNISNVCPDYIVDNSLVVEKNDGIVIGVIIWKKFFDMSVMEVLFRRIGFEEEIDFPRLFAREVWDYLIKDKDINSIIVRVVAEHIGQIRLFKLWGFSQCGVIEKSVNGYDVVLLQKFINSEDGNKIILS